ncbi:SAM-dependent methyltransferase [Microbulbifer flavimaris]|uniref:Ribosomal RNA small subunit methyltransferase J n=1 Tax=Microbulbifer flavimaris TaxID=1781068 RepID=A0ABX4I463_9GAMM|nr:MULTISPECIES: class I SAM-dependent methyltransferase [Microbulbifer]PCO06707.1 SAM-dependent methyltransferase [Microbulbifer flavimaris]
MIESLAVTAASESWAVSAQTLATELSLPYLGVVSAVAVDDYPQLLEVGETLKLCTTGRKAPGPVWVDFVGGAASHRRKFGGGKGQQIAKAIGIRSGSYPRVVDATAGLGRDAFVLASLGCEVLMLERNPVVRALLDDGLRRLREAAEADPELAPIAARLSLDESRLPAAEWLRQQPPESIPVVYLDPMFPQREKSAKVKKEMVAFHRLVGADEDADGLLDPAYAACYYRTVVKRPRLAPFLAGRKPSLSLEGKSGRFDIYTRHGMSRHGPSRNESPANQ